jgi:hypothetical protein
MRTIVPQRKWVSIAISSQDDLFAENLFGMKSALPQFVAMQREVP